MGNVTHGLLRMWSGEKIVDSRVLNRLGAQVIRTVAARTIYRSRPTKVTGVVKTMADDLARDGLVVWPDFLPEKTFARLRQEFLRMFEDPRLALRSASHGPNVLESAPVSRLALRLVPETLRCLEDPRLRALLEAAERRPLGRMVEYATVARLTQGVESGGVDPQTKLHCDIFFNTHKLWLYLSDVNLEDGPLVYVRGSHRLTMTQLGYIYQASCEYPPSGSRRVTTEEVAKIGRGETVVTCAANTCVVANTCGYHRRVRGVPGRRRDVLQLIVRANPFLAPWRSRAV